MVSVTGCILLQAFRDSLIPRAVLTSPEEAENEDIASLMQRLPSATKPFEEFLTAAQGYLLLLMFEQYLNLSGKIYSFTCKALVFYFCLSINRGHSNVSGSFMLILWKYSHLKNLSGGCLQLTTSGGMVRATRWKHCFSESSLIVLSPKYFGLWVQNPSGWPVNWKVTFNF